MLKLNIYLCTDSYFGPVLKGDSYFCQCFNYFIGRDSISHGLVSRGNVCFCKISKLKGITRIVKYLSCQQISLSSGCSSCPLLTIVNSVHMRAPLCQATTPPNRPSSLLLRSPVCDSPRSRVCRKVGHIDIKAVVQAICEHSS